MLVKQIGVLAPRCFEFAPELIRRLPSYTIKEIPYTGWDAPDAASENMLKFTPKEHSELVEELNKCEVLLTTPGLLAHFFNHLSPNVKWVQGTWAGVDCLLPVVNKNKLPSFTYTRYGGAFGIHLAEYVVSHVINEERRSRFLHNMKTQSKWAKDIFLQNGRPYRLLSEMSITVLGAGNIGQTIAKHCKNFGMTVYGMVSSERDPDEYIDKYFVPVKLAEYLKLSDVVCSALPATRQTDNLLSNNILRNCQQKQSVVINVGRANVLPEKDIIEALNRGWVKSFVLDIFEEEPLPKTSELWSRDEVVITPHVSGCTLTSEAVDTFITNVKLHENGKTLDFVVDWLKSY